jgi:hypothetical protein
MKYEDDEEPPFTLNGISQEKMMMFLRANQEAASSMTLEEVNVVVTEGILKLCTAMGLEVDSFITGVEAELMERIARTPVGRDMIHIIATLGDSMIMIMDAVNYLKENFPDYQNHLDKFHKEITDKVQQQEEKLIQEFVDSIPDSLEDME